MATVNLVQLVGACQVLVSAVPASGTVPRLISSILLQADSAPMTSHHFLALTQAMLLFAHLAQACLHPTARPNSTCLVYTHLLVIPRKQMCWASCALLSF